MRNTIMKKRIAAAAAAAVMTVTAAAGSLGTSDVKLVSGNSVTAYAAESTVKFLQSVGYGEAVYVTWSSVTGAKSYSVYVDGTKIDNMLVRQYPGYMRADAVGLKAGSHTVKVVPVINGSEDSSKAAQTTATAYAHDRSGYGFVNGTSSGAYNEDGTLKSNAVVLYVTNANKDSVSMDVVTDSKGGTTASTGIQNILTAYKKGYDTRPLDVRFIGNITDPATLDGGDLLVKGSSDSKRLDCGITIEGIGNDATFNGFGLRLANASNVEVRNIGFMNCNSTEGDDCGIQQSCDHIWVHNCDMFYGDAGSDADQVKGDGALDTKKSTYVTHSYNHFWDNGKCNLQGASASDTSNYITYHHNWYDHSDSRHPRVRVATVHVYNNYYDGNAKYGIGSTTDSDVFAENNYFRNCKYPMLISMQGNDVTAGGVFSGEDGGVIKAYGNVIVGGTFTSYQTNSTEFDAYAATSRSEKVPSTVTAKQGGASYNNFDTASDFYSYTVDKAEDVPTVVTSKAGRVDGGDFKWNFDDSVDDASYAVNDALKSALVNYKDTITAIGSGFTDDNTAAPVVVSTTTTSNTPVVTNITTTTTSTVTTATTTQTPGVVTPVTGGNVIYASPNGGGDGKTVSTPTDVLTAIKNVPAGGYIYLLDGTYKYDSTIKIEESNAGSAGKYKTIAAYPGATVKFDFSGEAVSSSSYGFVLDGSYWHFYGFEIANAGDNGMLLSGDNNIVEMMIFNGNQDTGLQISRYNGSYSDISQWPTNNLVKNCTSKNNCDDATMENADGFAAKLTCGQGNVFDGCISYCNSDDGWDLYAKEATGPIGVVTIKNCIAFRNGFTEDGKGYGDCDGNGFKLGGGGVGTRHVVENCLAFENLNCGFTDNNNPEFGDIKDCTAYNNGIGGNGKGNYFVYRCSTTATLTNLLSYYNTSKVSKTNAPGIKLASDKFVGSMTNSIHFNNNGSYYYVKSQTTIASGDKIGDVITPADSDFITLSVGAMGTDFHKAWRNSSGAPSPAGFAETNGTYKTLGYHMYSGISQTATPDVYAAGTTPVDTATTTTTTATTSGGGQSSTTTTTTQIPVPVSGGYVHNFTENGTASSFYTISGNLSTAKGTVTYNGLTLTQCLKIESATSIGFRAANAGTITLVFAEADATIKIDGTKYTSSGDGIITVDLAAGDHAITKADSANLFYMVFTESGAPVSKYLAGDADCDGEVKMNDVVLIMQVVSNNDRYGVGGTAEKPITEQGLENADVSGNMNGLSVMDALAVQRYLLELLPSLPEV